MTGDEKHDLAAYSTLDVLRVLYERVLDVSPETVDDPRRDRFLLSKGHGPMAYYAVLCDRGSPRGVARPSGRRSTPRSGYHPDRNLVPGVEISSGSLGHGLPLGVGYGARPARPGHRSRVVVLVGDAELDEGRNHEALELAGRSGSTRSPWSSSTTASVATPCPGGSPSGSRPRAGTSSPSTAATTTRSRRP
jgi:transketolase